MVNHSTAVAVLLTFMKTVAGFGPPSEPVVGRTIYKAPHQFGRQLASSAYFQDDSDENNVVENFRKDVDRLGGKVNELGSEYLESFSRALTEDDIDTDEAELARKKKIVLERNREYQVTLPLTQSLGVTLCQVDATQEFSDVDLNIDSLLYQSPPAPKTDTQEGEVAAMNPCEVKKRLDPYFRGVVVSSVVHGGRAWEEGVRPGDVLVSTSATMGDALWPKSTLEGVRSAIASRKVSAGTIALRLERITENAVSQYELALTKPLGIKVQETDDGFVVVTGFTVNAQKLARYAINVGDRILAVDAAIGDRLWPVSTVEGLISACTSRLPGQPIRMRFARPYTEMEDATDQLKTMAPITTSVNAAAAMDSTAVEVAVTTGSATDTQLLSRCREVLKRYSEKEQKMDKVKFVGKYSLPGLVADKVIDAVASASSSFDSVTLSMVMNAYLSCRQPDAAIRIFEAAVGLKADGSSAAVVETINGKDKGALVPNKAALNLVTGSSLMRAYSLKGDSASVQRVLAALEGRSGFKIDGIESMEWPNTGIYGSIIPDTQCYNIALSAVAKQKDSGGVDTALDIFESMSEPSQTGSGKPAKDLVSFNTIIGALAKAGRSEEAFSMLDRMKRSKVKPDKYTYTSLINACVKEGDIQELLIDMKEQGVQPDVVTYNTMIKSLCDRYQWGDAKNLVTEMESRGISPDSLTYGRLMSGLLKANKPNICLTLFESACSDRRTASLTENVHLYTTAITAASAIGNYERALELVSRMNSAGVKANLKTLTALMSACLSSGKPDLAASVFGRIDQPDGYAMLMAIRAMCANGDLKDATKAIALQQSGRAEMSGKQVMEAFQILIRTSLELGDFGTARQTFTDLLKANYIPSKSIFQSIVQTLGLIPSKQSTRSPAEFAKTIPDTSFDFLLFLLDSLRERNLPCDGSFYTTVLHTGARIGGLRRKLASLLAESRAVTVDANIGFRAGAVVLSEEARGKIVVGWEDLVGNYDTYKGRLGDDVELPPLAVRVASKEVRQVLAAEQRVTYVQRARRQLV